MRKPLPEKWVRWIVDQPETGMGYWVVSVTLTDRTVVKRVVVADGFFTQAYGKKGIPFDPDDIEQIEVTHDKWKFN